MMLILTMFVRSCQHNTKKEKKKNTLDFFSSHEHTLVWPEIKALKETFDGARSLCTVNVGQSIK